jgi:hypothetical protein
MIPQNHWKGLLIYSATPKQEETSKFRTLVTIEKEIPLDESCPLYKSLIFDPILLPYHMLSSSTS